MSDDKQWAKHYVLDPLTEPEPSAEMGPGTSLRPQNVPTAANPLAPPLAQSTNSATKSGPTATVTETAQPITTAQIREASQRQAAMDKNSPQVQINEYFKDEPSKTQPSVQVREQTTGDSNNPFRQGNSPVAADKAGVSSHVRQVSRESNIHGGPSPRRADAVHSQSGASSSGHRRKSSLTPRFPGDISDHPLEQLKRENKAADRAPHLQKRHLPGADLIDRLDDSGFKYHHEGPFDAALLARNTSYTSSPVAALTSTTQEALNATPQDKIKESLDLHRPLDGTAFVPPGHQDAQGRTMHYEEGEDLMVEQGGDLGRWDGVDYKKEDHEARGEPAFSLGKDLHEHGHGEGHGEAIELVERPHGKAYDSRDPVAIAGGNQNYAAMEEYRAHQARPASPAHGSRFSGELKRRIGSLRGKKKE